jgi:SAM-dependent methyltransferase
MRPAGSVLEIACGTGLWTEALAGWADTVTAIDAAPEAVAIARDRVRPANVSFEVADVFSWNPGTRFDVIFFSAWLSHVPASRFGQFWQLLESLLAGNGRVLFIDEHVDERRKETYVAGRDERARVAFLVPGPADGPVHVRLCGPGRRPAHGALAHPGNPVGQRHPAGAPLPSPAVRRPLQDRDGPRHDLHADPDAPALAAGSALSHRLGPAYHDPFGIIESSFAERFVVLAQLTAGLPAGRAT